MWLVLYEDGWSVRREGSKSIMPKHRYKDTAIKKAKTIARKYKADVIIHNSVMNDREIGHIPSR